MKTYISILRGINVSGQKKIQMAGLKKLYEDLNFKDVTTYIQSGNVIFRVSEKIAEIALSEKIGKKIFEQYGFQVPVILRDSKEMKAVVDQNPFSGKRVIDLSKLHVTFLSKVPRKMLADSLLTFQQTIDRFIISGREIYLYCPNGYGTTKLSNTFFERKLEVTATTRNWKTVMTLNEIATTQFLS